MSRRCKTNVLRKRSTPTRGHRGTRRGGDRRLLLCRGVVRRIRGGSNTAVVDHYNRSLSYRGRRRRRTQTVLSWRSEPSPRRVERPCWREKPPAERGRTAIRTQ